MMDMFGSLFGIPPEKDWRQDNRLDIGLAVNRKVEELRQRGFSVRPAPGPIPGLWEVSGHPELTTGQLLNL